MRIVTGALRGRRIPSGRLGDLRLTSSRLKEAIFSMLGGDLVGTSFLDLCAGSGQMGLEALSRGARVVFNEPDPRRYRHLRNLLYQWRIGAEMHQARAEVLIPRLGEEGRRFHCVYVDPPYRARHGGQPLCQVLLARLGAAHLLQEDGVVLVQHPAELELPAASGALACRRRRRYGATCLSAYALA